MQQIKEYLNLKEIVNQVYGSEFDNIYYQQYSQPTSYGFNTGLFDGNFIFVKNNEAKLGLLYKFSFGTLNLMFFRYRTPTDIVYGSSQFLLSYFDKETIKNKLRQALQQMKKMEQ